MKGQNMKIGIIGAMEYEVERLKSELSDVCVETRLGREFYSGTLDGVPCVVVMCGMGKINAALCAHTMIVQMGATHVINTGAAGSLDAGLDIGDIVVATDVVHHDVHVEPLGYAPGQVPDVDVLFFETDGELRRAAVEAVAVVAPEVKAVEGRIASGDQFIASAEEKERIVSSFGAICCEMEGASIAQASYLAGVPFVIVRAISDKADGSAEVDFGVFVREAAARSAAIVEHMVRSFASRN